MFAALPLDVRKVSDFPLDSQLFVEAVPHVRRRKTEAEPQIVGEIFTRKVRDFPHIGGQSPIIFFA
jgi:hypothetical protein